MLLMPFGYTIDLSRRLVLSRGWGILTELEILRHVHLLTADPRFEPSMRQLADFRAVTDLELDADTIRQLASLSPFGAGSQRALLVGSDVAYGMARMFQIMREDSPDELNVFRGFSSALDWLGLAHEEASILAQLETTPLPDSAASDTG
jgi:hypothetical protein